MSLALSLSAARMGGGDRLHRGGRVHQYAGPFGKADEGITGSAYGFVPIVCVIAHPKGGLVYQVSADFRPFVEKFDCVRKAGNLLHDVRSALHEDGAAENVSVHSFLSNLLDDRSEEATASKHAEHRRLFCPGDDVHEAIMLTMANSPSFCGMIGSGMGLGSAFGCRPPALAEPGFKIE